MLIANQGRWLTLTLCFWKHFFQSHTSHMTGIVFLFVFFKTLEAFQSDQIYKWRRCFANLCCCCCCSLMGSCTYTIVAWKLANYFSLRFDSFQKRSSHALMSITPFYCSSDSVVAVIVNRNTQKWFFSQSQALLSNQVYMSTAQNTNSSSLPSPDAHWMTRKRINRWEDHLQITIL